MRKDLLKISLLASVLFCAGVYLLAGAFVALFLSLWPVQAQSSDPLETVSLDYSFQQAAPSQLQPSINVQGQ